jgi:hypothetical protein
MLIAGANFALHIQLFRGKPLALWRDPKFRFSNLGRLRPARTLPGKGNFPPRRLGR